jgi:hypothetical protein
MPKIAPKTIAINICPVNPEKKDGFLVVLVFIKLIVRF